MSHHLEEKIAKYGENALDSLNDLVKKGKNEVAVAAAGKTLIETALGKPKSNDQDVSKFGNVTINVQRLEDIKPLLNEVKKEQVS